MRAQLAPRLTALSETRPLLEQAFVRWSPFAAHELALFAGRFDSVFGIEYLDNQAVLRTGVTPSLVARYTTGPSTGLKVFYRRQLPLISGAVSLNAAATDSGAVVDALQAPDASLTGVPVLSGRLGLELNLRALELKLGASGLTGPRNDQHDSHVKQQQWGLDARLVFAGLSLSGELVRVFQDPGGWDKQTGQGPQTVVSGFEARGGTATIAWAVGTPWSGLRKLVPYLRYDRRHAQFEGYTPLTVDRFTAGLRLELWDGLLVKGEVLLNRELAGAPQVDNDVITSSVVYAW